MQTLKIEESEVDEIFLFKFTNWGLAKFMIIACRCHHTRPIHTLSKYYHDLQIEYILCPFILKFKYYYLSLLIIGLLQSILDFLHEFNLLFYPWSCQVPP